jgi:DNA-directed RNA polymerase specialized sigma24 family protein
VADDYDVDLSEHSAIIARDRDVFSRWFARSELSLKRSLRSFAEVADVEAIVQDTAVKIWQGASRILPDGRPGFLLRWARTVAVNAARNAARQSGRHVSLPPDLPAVDRPGAGSDPLLRERVRRCLERLLPGQRRAFEARISDGGSRNDRELASSSGMSFDAFRQHLARGRKALVGCLGSYGIDVLEYLR